MLSSKRRTYRAVPIVVVVFLYFFSIMRVLGTIAGAIAAMLVLLIGKLMLSIESCQSGFANFIAVYNLGSGALQTGAKPYLLAILSVPVYWGSTVLVMKYPQYQYASVMACIVYVLIIFGEYRGKFS